MAVSPALLGYWQVKPDMAYGVRKAIGGTWCSMVVGDSRASAWPHKTLGGSPCFEGGLPGATIKDALTYLPPVVKNFGPRVTIIQLGINTIWVPLDNPQWQTLTADLTNLITQLRPWTPHIILTTPIPPEKGAWRPDADVILRAGWLWGVMKVVRDVALAENVHLVDLYADFVCPDGTAKPGTTWDGIHLTQATYDTIKCKLDPVAAGLIST